MSKRTCVLLSLAFAFLVVVRQYGTEVEKVNELDEEISLNKSSSFNSSYHNDTAILSSQAPAPRSNSNHHFITPNSFEEKWSWNNTDWNEWVGKCCGRYINTHTGCRLARWYYLPDDISNPAPRIHHRDCDSMPTHRKLIHPRVLKENDTIYVNFIALEKFIDRILDDITVKMVIISGQDHLVLVPPADHAKIKKLLDNKNVLHWFCQNLPIYGGGNLEHEKLSPWPYGLKGSEHMASSNFNHRSLKHSLESSTNKTKLIYAGPLTKTNAIRKHIPQESERISQSEFFGKIASAYYILSPDGDRPDCHRHYESILFGTVPITQMDSFLYRHLSGGPVIFDNANWNLTAIGKRLDPTPVVNRNLMLQDYWRDFADYIVGFELNWSKDSQDMYGFASGPNDAWSPIREAKNEWVQVSDFLGLCTRYSMMNLANPEWGLSGNGSEAMTRHIACCLESSGTNSSLTETTNRTSTEDGALQQSMLEKPSWFDRESGWSGSTYNEAEKFCLAKGSSLCSYAQICPEGVVSHLNI